MPVLCLAAALGEVCLCARSVSLRCVLAGGDGPKAAMLRETIRREGLRDRVTMLGAVPSEGVRDVLVRCSTLRVHLVRQIPGFHLLIFYFYRLFDEKLRD